MGSEQHYSLRWNDYTVKIVSAFQSLRDEEDFVDVTIACDGHSYSAHKMVLSACSPYFRSLLRANPCQHPIVILKDVGHVELERLLEFMYNGEVSIAQDQLAAFLKTAENLKIRGLAGSSEEMDQLNRQDVSYSYSCSAVGGGGGASGRSSPSAYAHSQGSKDEEYAVDGGGYHQRPESPPSKRRRRVPTSMTNPASAAGHLDPNSASHIAGVYFPEGETGDCALEVGVGGSILPGRNLDGTDNIRLDRREMKSEPGDSLGELYSEGSELSTDPHGHDGLDSRQSSLYPIAMPGPSGAIGNQDNSHEPGAVPGGAVCEALNLSLRPAVSQVNGSLPPPLPPPSSAHHRPLHHHIHHLQQAPAHHPPAAASATPLNHYDDNIEMFDVKVHTVVATAASGLVYSDRAPDLIVHEKIELMGEGSDGHVGIMMDGSPEYKAKVYPCPECHKVFRHPMSLHHHRHVHKGTYTCHSCGKVFSRRWDLHRHLHRSKMGCRRPSHPSSGTHGSLAANIAAHRPEFTLDLNNSPSN